MTIPVLGAYQQFEGRIRRLRPAADQELHLRQVARLGADLDAYNALNSSAIQNINNTYGPAWKTPTQILDPRLFQVRSPLDC